MIIHDFPAVKVIKNNDKSNNVNRFLVWFNAACRSVFGTASKMRIYSKGGGFYVELVGLDDNKKNTYQLTFKNSAYKTYVTGIDFEEGYFKLVEEPGGLFVFEKIE